MGWEATKSRLVRLALVAPIVAACNSVPSSTPTSEQSKVVLPITSSAAAPPEPPKTQVLRDSAFFEPGVSYKEGAKEEYAVRLANLIEKTKPELKKELNGTFPNGFQVDLYSGIKNAISEEQQFYDHKGRLLDAQSVKFARLPNGKLQVMIRVGILTIAPFENDPSFVFYSPLSDKEIDINIQEGKVVIGDSLLHPQDVYTSFLSIFTADGQFRTDVRGVHIGTKRNLAFFDIKGEPLK